MNSIPAGAHPARLQRIVTDYAAPDYVLGASSDDLFGAGTAAGFADPVTRLYPVHTKAAAWLSAAAADEAGETRPEVLDRLARAARQHGVGPVTRTDEAKAAAAAADASRRFALPAARSYPIDHPEQVKAATAYFDRYADRLPTTDRRAFAANVAARAEELDCLPDDALDRLQKEAGEWSPGSDGVLTDAVRVRVALAETTGRPALADALSKAAADGPGGDGVELAAHLRDVDRTCGWDLPDPLAGVTTRAGARAKLAGAVAAASGNWYRVADLDRIPHEVLAAYGAAPVLSRAGYERLLSSKNAAALESVAADYGVFPVEAGPRRQADWAGLAALAAPAFGREA